MAHRFRLAVLLLGACSSGCVEPARSPAPNRVPSVASGPRLVVLGTVQDGGLPHAACRCAHCAVALDDPSRRRQVASLAVVLPASNETYLIDATPDIRQQLQELLRYRPERQAGVDRSPVDGVLLTHAHMGHYTGLAFFGFEAVHTRELRVYCSASLAAFLRGNGPWSQLVQKANIALREIRSGESRPLGKGIEFTPVAVPHRDEYSDTLGFRIRGSRSTVLYVPDTDSWEAWGTALDRALTGVDVAILDGTFFSAEELPGRDMAPIGHPTIRASLERFGGRVRAGEIRVYFTHLNHTNPALDPTSPERAEIERRGFRVLSEHDEFPL